MAGCYRPPSAPACTFKALFRALAPFTRSEHVLLGDLNWDMLMPPEKVTQQLDSLNLHQIITHPTRLNSNCPDKASLLDVIITNTPYMYQYGVFCSDLSYHCFIACIRLNISAKQPITISIKRSLKHFNTQAFLHDLANMNWHRVRLVPSLNDAWTLFKDQLSNVVNKHAPLKKQRLKNRHSPWFTQERTSLL